MKPSDVIAFILTASEKLSDASTSTDQLPHLGGVEFQETLLSAITDTQAGLNALQALLVAEQLSVLPSAIPGNVVAGEVLFNQESITE